MECIYDSNIIVEATGTKPLDEHSFEGVIKQHNYEQYLGQTKTYLRKEMKEIVLDKPTRFGVFVKLNYVLKGFKF